MSEHMNWDQQLNAVQSISDAMVEIVKGFRGGHQSLWELTTLMNVHMIATLSRATGISEDDLTEDQVVVMKNLLPKLRNITDEPEWAHRPEGRA